ncbi:sodium channel subunit beta-2 isoform X3 [Phycodurus eques]|uniref:sodium channel subunit beta-2 isoform X2 n=1 Tax=Phycodurus eques TaxID=693459 RepID=UPI002ACD9871|nr:sodium channel subunit beta-2 isoform X2 [Phycodurus eques]XP_061537483.1 sodium channel subunit beta-2 isoform X3 [Phycodurus eques]
MCVSALAERRSDVRLLLLLLTVMLSFSGCASMDVIVPSKINVMNGSDIKIPCTFTSCYKIDTNKFVMNWTYHESVNDTEQMFLAYDRKKGMVALLPERFGDRVLFAGNLEKNDMSITLLDVQEEDEGIYNCYVINPPDRIHGHGDIKLKVFTERSALRGEDGGGREIRGRRCHRGGNKTTINGPSRQAPAKLSTQNLP